MSDDTDFKELMAEVGYKDAIIEELESEMDKLSERVAQMGLVTKDMNWLLWNQTVVRYQALLAMQDEPCSVLREAMLSKGLQEHNVPPCGFCMHYDKDCGVCPLGDVLGECAGDEDAAWTRAHRLLFKDEDREAWKVVINEIIDEARSHVV